MKTPSEQQVLQNCQWLLSEGYRLGYEDAKAGRPSKADKPLCATASPYDCSGSAAKEYPGE